MADAELETFTSIMDALVRISVSTTLMSYLFQYLYRLCVLKKLAGKSSSSLLVRPACYSVRPIKHMVQIVTEEFIAIRFPLQFLLPSISKSVYAQAVLTKRVHVWPRIANEKHLRDVANKLMCV